MYRTISLLPHIAKVERSRDTNNDIRALSLIQTRYHEGQALPPLPARRSRMHRDAIPERIDEPKCKSCKHTRVGEQRQVRALRECDESVGTQGLDILLVDDRCALSDDCTVQGHRQWQSIFESGDAALG
jgi:hypothetical protein